jgi:SAM-dependent methyltransferase
VLLAERFEEVIATDASAAQIAAAEARAGVTYRAAPAQASGLEAGSADLVTVAQAAHWFDLDPFYAEVRRVLRPRGVVALVTYGVIEAEPAIDALVQHFYWTVAGPYWPPERRLVEEGYRSLPFPFAEFALPPLAIEVSWSADDLIGYVGTWSALRQLETTEGRGPLDTFAAELRRNWGAPERRLFRFPLSVRAGRVG